MVVAVPVPGLVFANDQNDITQSGVGRHVPVFAGDLRGRWVGMAALVDVGQVVCIAGYGLLLEIANDAVCGLRRKQIEEEVEIVEYGLSQHDHDPF